MTVLVPQNEQVVQAWKRMVARTTARANIDERLRGRTTELTEQCRLNRALPTNIASMTVVKIKEELRKEGLPTTGLKAILVERLAARAGRQEKTQPEGATTATPTASEEPGVPCPTPNCTEKLIIRAARRGGRFWGCPSYPQCKGTRQLEEGMRMMSASSPQQENDTTAGRIGPEALEDVTILLEGLTREMMRAAGASRM